MNAEKMPPSDTGASSRDGSEKPDTIESPSQASEEHPSAETPGDGSLEKAGPGAPLDRVPSQAQKLGKKKIVVVMTALCVCLLAPGLLIALRLVVATLTACSCDSSFCSWQLWIW